jgi:hypothetical protein
MRNRFTGGLCVLAASAAVTITLGLSAAGAASAATHQVKPHGKSNATITCGGNCFDLSSELLDHNAPGSAIQNAVGGPVLGNNVNIRQAGNNRSNEDFTNEFVGIVAQFCDGDFGFNPNGIFDQNSVACTHYLFSPVFEADSSPLGRTSGLCVGVAVPDVSMRVSLQPCGVKATSLWIADTFHGVTDSNGSDYVPWINGGSIQFSHPYVLTVNTASHHPANVLRVATEQTSSGQVTDNQQFSIDNDTPVGSSPR